MTEDKKKILERLRKLFALGSSPNQHEAEAAMAKANEIMQEYQIGMSDVDMAAEGSVTREDVVVAKGDGVKNWVVSLGRAAAELYDGDCAWHYDKRKMTFIGTPTDIEAMKMTFVHLYESWKSIVEHDLKGAKAAVSAPFAPRDTMLYKHGHGTGYAEALRIRVYALVQVRKKKVKSATGRDLVVVKGQALKDWMDNAGYETKKGNFSGGNSDGREHGRAAGNAVPLGGVTTDRRHMIGRA